MENYRLGLCKVITLSEASKHELKECYDLSTVIKYYCMQLRSRGKLMSSTPPRCLRAYTPGTSVVMNIYQAWLSRNSASQPSNAWQTLANDMIPKRRRCRCLSTSRFNTAGCRWNCDGVVVAGRCYWHTRTGHPCKESHAGHRPAEGPWLPNCWSSCRHWIRGLPLWWNPRTVVR